jgi:hypothetical protein
MKTLYYHEFAKSIDDNGNPIPAKKLKWKVPKWSRIAFEDPEYCLKVRLENQENLKYHIIRVVQAGRLKSIGIRLNAWLWNGDDWTILK